MIIDEFTGRILEGRRWSEGLHQAIEAKEGVAIREENQTLATITLQNYFRLYDKLSGMTGTALTEATGVHEDLRDAGGRDPDQPGHGPRRRQRPDLQDQGRQVEGRRQRDRGAQRDRPADPVGTVSVEVSEMLSEQFKRRGIEHVVLNAKPEHAQKRGRDGRPGRAASARSRSRPTWPAAASTSSSAATPSMMAEARAPQARRQARGRRTTRRSSRR